MLFSSCFVVKIKDQSNSKTAASSLDQPPCDFQLLATIFYGFLLENTDKQKWTPGESYPWAFFLFHFRPSGNFYHQKPAFFTYYWKGKHTLHWFYFFECRFGTSKGISNRTFYWQNETNSEYPTSLAILALFGKFYPPHFMLQGGNKLNWIRQKLLWFTWILYTKDHFLLCPLYV